MAPMTEATTDTSPEPATTGRPRPRPARLVPADWPWALRAGVESAALGWLAVVVPTVAVYLATSSLDAAAALTGVGKYGAARHALAQARQHFLAHRQTARANDCAERLGNLPIPDLNIPAN